MLNPDLPLSLVQGLCQHVALDGEVVHPEGAHEVLDAVPAKDAEEVVLQAQEVPGGARVACGSATAAPKVSDACAGVASRRIAGGMTGQEGREGGGAPHPGVRRGHAVGCRCGATRASRFRRRGGRRGP